MRPLILQQGVERYKPLLDFSAPFTSAYAKANEIDFELCQFTVRASWSTHEKFLLPLRFMTGSGRLLAVLDADVLVIGRDRFEIEIGESDFAAVVNQNGEMNVGVYFIRDTACSAKMLQRCALLLDGEIQRTGSIYCDQMLMNNMVRSSGITVKYLDRCWNDYGFAAGRSTRQTQIKGFHDLAVSPELKLQQMQRFAENIKNAA